jgi:hypothetical protein
VLIKGIFQNGIYSAQLKKKEKNTCMSGADKKLNIKYMTVFFVFIFKNAGGNNTFISIGTG